MVRTTVLHSSLWSPPQRVWISGLSGVHSAFLASLLDRGIDEFTPGRCMGVASLYCEFYSGSLAADSDQIYLAWGVKSGLGPK